MLTILWVAIRDTDIILTSKNTKNTKTLYMRTRIARAPALLACYRRDARIARII